MAFLCSFTGIKLFFSDTVKKLCYVFQNWSTKTKIELKLKNKIDYLQVEEEQNRIFTK